MLHWIDSDGEPPPPGGDGLPGLNTSFTAIKANALANGIGTAGIMHLGPAHDTAKPSGPHMSPSPDRVAKGDRWVALFFGPKRTVSGFFPSLARSVQD